VPEHPEIFARWAREAENFRAQHADAELGIPYGTTPRQKIDLFWRRAGCAAPVVLFIHGGYWRSLSPDFFSQVAGGANAHGLAVAIAGYDLCPGVSIAAIVEEVRTAAAFLWRRHKKKLLVCGWSAGGHLAACLLATDWMRVAPDLPPDLVPAAFALSGLFDLAPLLHTSMNADLKLDAAEAHRLSPVFWELPAGGRTIDVWAGSRESAEFIRQSCALAEVWARKGVVARYFEVAGANHFTMVDPLSDPASGMTARLVELARAIG